jgi:TctA family transporter
VRLLRVPYRFLYPSALFFIAVGVYSTRNNLFDVAIVAAFGVVGAILLALEFPLSPIVLGFVLGPMLEEKFRQATLLSRGDLSVFVTRPIAAAFVGASALLVLIQLAAWWRGRRLIAAPAVSAS